MQLVTKIAFGESRFRTFGKREHGGRPDISKADFTFCMTAIDWGWNPEETVQQLRKESTKVQENGEKYAFTTARNAAAVERRGQPVKSTPTPENPESF